MYDKPETYIARGAPDGFNVAYGLVAIAQAIVQAARIMKGLER